MQTVPIYQLKNELSRFIQMVELGEDISITRRGAEVARLVPPVQRVLPNRAESIRAKRVLFANVSAFNERDITAQGRRVLP
ncbi:MAG: hypothetical protein AUJ20_13965 [Comamonadaceae bacterium CG1_02_60_18]|nr:MAG: hypothetical protein AUJ20_13965 [Comamonadaceae bacterium CG1_02_60_18]PIQ52546.1 MAG: type II toxin-antitoxin system prevent-host-death family antitoxin [Comamonadaceae bacterium CG12_big_fil_rev_8_21_14_0_65_59_15]